MKFNAFANLAQNAIFEDLFYDYARAVQGTNFKKFNTSYSDIQKNRREMVDIFAKFTDATNFTYSPTTNSWSYTGNDFYRTENISLCKIATVNANALVVGNEYVIATIGSTDFTALGAASNTVGITFIATAIGTGTGTVNYTSKKVDIEEVDKIRVNAMVNSPNKPTLTYPIYTKEGDSYKIYPTIPATGYRPELFFIRKPKDVKWTYQTISGTAVYDPSQPDAQDCELPQALFENMVVKILGYAGLSLREQEVEMIANNEEQKQTINQS